MKHFKSKTLTWRSGTFHFKTGALQIAVPDNQALGQIGSLLSLSTGPAGGAVAVNPALEPTGTPVIPAMRNWCPVG